VGKEALYRLILEHCAVDILFHFTNALYPHITDHRRFITVASNSVLQWNTPFSDYPSLMCTMHLQRTYQNQTVGWIQRPKQTVTIYSVPNYRRSQMHAESACMQNKPTSFREKLSGTRRPIVWVFTCCHLSAGSCGKTTAQMHTDTYKNESGQRLE
jgi:hypothetical protein